MINIAIPKGRLGKSAVRLLQNCNIGKSINMDSRELIFEDVENNMKFMFLKNSDVITYVEKGIADLGIAGEDMLMEVKPNLYKLKNLQIGKCKISMAAKVEDKFSYQIENKPKNVLRVATKFENIAREYFQERCQNVDIIKLNGSIELAPLLGLSDVIVDIVETGNTLKANGLEVIEDMYPISAYLISNKVSYRFNKERINKILELLD